MEKNKTYTIHISAEADPRLHAMFRSLGYDTDEFRTSGIVAGPVSCHPDMFMCRMGPDIGAELIRYTAGCGVSLRPVYPYDIAFNVACTGRYFNHNLKYTALQLLRRAEELSLDGMGHGDIIGHPEIMTEKIKKFM